MIKQLMVAMDDGEYAESAAEHACELAKIHEAKVLGMVIADTYDIETAYHSPRPLGAGSSGKEHYEKAILEAKGFAEKARDQLVKICEKHGVKYKASLVEGSPTQEILKHSTLCDLVIMGRRTRFTCGLPDGQFCNAAEEVLARSFRPLMLASEKKKEVKKVMIALDLQRLSDRLLFNYVHLNPFPGAEIHLVHASPEHNNGGGKKFPAEIEEYFNVHGMSVKSKILHGDNPGQAIVNYAGMEGIDLAVIGIHSVSKIWEVLMGSTSRYIMEHMVDTPMFTQT